MTQSDTLRTLENHDVRLKHLEYQSQEDSDRMLRMEGKMDKLIWLIVAVILEIPISVVL